MGNLINYAGELGTFSYDDSEYSVRHDDYGEYLHYDGSETDGAKIVIPNGVVNLRSTFEYTGIRSMPCIPDGVVNMDYTFQAAADLETTGSEHIPDGVKTMNGTFSYCMKVKNVPDMPDSVESSDYMLDGSKNVVKLGHVSGNLKSAAYMCNECMNYKGPFDILPESLRGDEIVFQGCFGKDEAYEGEQFMQKALDDRNAAYETKDASEDKAIESEKASKPDVSVDRTVMPFDFEEQAGDDGLPSIER